MVIEALAGLVGWAFWATPGLAQAPPLAWDDQGLAWRFTLLDVFKFAWAFAFGACVGSLMNVLVYRVPLGLSVVSPPSRCPSCGTRLTWRENIPVLGWLFLRGRCRFCSSPVSAEYPLVEAFMGLLWGVTFLVCYSDPSGHVYPLVSAVQPDWAHAGFVRTWPIFLVVITLFSMLVGATLVDAKTSTIPAVFTNVPLVVACVAHLGHAAWVQARWGQLPSLPPGHAWSIWTPHAFGWQWVGLAAGGVLGLLIANLLLWKGVLRRSFADYQEWEDRVLREHAEKVAAERALGEGGSEEREGDDAPDAPDLWVQYPHARREMLREVLFLGIPVALGLVGAWLAMELTGPWAFNPSTLLMEPVSDVQVPLWARVGAGVALGFLVGGGVVWAFRLVGSLLFGKEAMGLGDVHLMAAVGACLGVIDPVLAFFAGAIVGMLWWVIGFVRRKAGKHHLPFGPYLAVGTLVVWFGKPALERLWGLGLNAPTNWP